MRATDTLIIGAGQAGLALSRLLTETGADHVLLERGGIGHRWEHERWDSLRLLTPNWMTRLPHGAYDGPDPHGFMTGRELLAHLRRYAAGFAAPVESGTTVIQVSHVGDAYLVDTDRGAWRARNVVIATGAADRPAIPAMASRLPSDIHQTSPARYRNPSGLPDGGVLVVGASASGAQIADELARAGRQVTLAVGRHTRMVRRYRGRDVMWWLDRIGALHDPIDRVGDPEAARRTPSLQLVGRPDQEDLDLGSLAAAGVRLAGRLVEIDGSSVGFADDLAATVSAADARLERLLGRIDTTARRLGLDSDPSLPGPHRPAATSATTGARRLDLRAEGIGTVLWATGFRRSYPWLAVPVLDADGEIVQRAGATAAPGLFVLGLRFQTRRNSNFIDGVGHDACLVAHHIRRRANVPAAA
jgi:putative flavoprotein involved in K+ transport